ncbi:MAG: Methyltransferase [Candidatus Tokpelaia hoelldobleri]|uniref:Methyltransferase n=1 Tax=Candidatus Tokpelaia hoelldobleri TaxID=1902579 RepID=A0A1U9JT90_9HYPH|nr:MAG: Methyltransferase [Candidatus Tokpelaia hoelldoblerii]
MTETMQQEAETQTADIFHRGQFCLVQPAARGQRSGVDAMLLAGAVPQGFAGRLADLGAGAGAAGLAVAARCPDAQVALVENSPFMLEFARKTLEHRQNAALKPRLGIIAADVTLAGKSRRAAGLADNAFDFAIMNPPFNASRDRATPDAEKARAHVMGEGLWQTWIRTAAAIVRPRGGFALIARPVSIAGILSAFDRRFGGVKIVPVYPRAGDSAIRIVVAATRASRAGLQVAPPLVLHEGPGHTFSARADAINNGLASLWD